MPDMLAEEILLADVVDTVPDPTGPILLRRPITVEANADRAGTDQSLAADPPSSPSLCDPEMDALWSEALLLFWLAAAIAAELVLLRH